MKTIISMTIPSFEVQVKFVPVPNTPEAQHSLKLQKVDDDKFALSDYCKTQGFYSKLASDEGDEPVLQKNEDYMKVVPSIVNGPQQINGRNFHYPLNVLTLNLYSPDYLTSAMPYYPATPEGADRAIDRIVRDIRSKLQSYGVKVGYSILIKSDFGGEPTEEMHGPFFDEDLDSPLSPENLVHVFESGSVPGLRYIIDTFRNGKYPPLFTDELRKRLTQPLHDMATNKAKALKIYNDAFLKLLIQHIQLLCPDSQIASGIKGILGGPSSPVEPHGFHA